MKKTFYSLLISAILAAALALSASAGLYNITGSEYPESYTKMMKLIDNQNLTSPSRDTVKNVIKHYAYNSKYAAYYGNKKFEYLNCGYDVSRISDGTYSTDLGGGCRGCFAYAQHVSVAIYNDTKKSNKQFHGESAGYVTGGGLKQFLLTYAQAGEHLRIDNTHSIVYVSGDDSGFYYFNYENDSNNIITMHYETYEDFAAEYKYKAIWLYNVNTNINDPNKVNQPQTPAKPACAHKYNSSGYCKKCNAEYEMNVEYVAANDYTVIKKDTPIRTRPYATNKTLFKLSVGDTVTVVAKANNYLGNPWYLIEYQGSRYWVYSENVLLLNKITVRLGEITNQGTNTLRVNATCSYTQKRPDRVVLLLGTKKNQMEIVDYDIINFTKNPFDIWYDLKNLVPGVTYYYQIAAVFDNPSQELVHRDGYKSEIGTFVIDTNYHKVVETAHVTQSAFTMDVGAVTKLTSTTARINASCSYKGTRPNTVCAYLGTSPQNMTQIGIDSINFAKNPFDVWYDLNGLTPSTTYYYQFHTDVNGDRISSEIYSFSTLPKSMIGTALGALNTPVTITVKDVSNINSTSARINATCVYTNTRPSTVCAYLGTSPQSMKQIGSDSINFTKNPFDIWYDLSGLAPNTTYYYQFHADVNGTRCSSNVAAFTTGVGAVTSQNTYTAYVVDTGGDSLAINNKPAASPAYSTELAAVPMGKAVTVYPDKQSGNWHYVSYNGIYGYAYGKYLSKTAPGTSNASITIAVKNVSSVTSTTARINATCTYTNTRPSTVCAYLGTSPQSMKQIGSDSINFTKNPFDIWYDLSGLAPSTTYYYQFHADVNGTRYSTDIASFTTASAQNSYTAYVVGTGGANLAINNKPAASPTYSTELIAVPLGASVTVYPDKQSGNWYYVSYNGVYGYAYGKYLAAKQTA